MQETKQFDFELFTDKQLSLLLAQVMREIAHRRGLRRRLRARGGLSESESPRYRNPANPSQTWAGRGKAPSWFEEAIANGVCLDDLMHEDDRPAAPGGARKPKSTRKPRKDHSEG